jgi:transposase
MTNPREAELLQEVAEREAQLAQRNEEVARLQAENELLRQKVDHLARQLFGRSSEQLDPNQLQLLLQELVAPGPAVGKELGPETAEAPAPEPEKTAPPKPRERQPRLPEHLPVVEEKIIPLEVQIAPEQWRQIGEEVTERLDYTPGRFVRRRLVRPKYVRRDTIDGKPVIAPLPPCLLERSILTAGLLAQVVVSKYCDHLPLYRQEYIYESRYGVTISRQSMSEWVGVAADWLQLIYEEIRGGVMSKGYVQIDETPIRYLCPGAGRARTGYLWTCHLPGGETVYSWHTSRAASCLQQIVPADFDGYLQCDGYTGYDAFAATRKDITLVGCWAHVRRKFYAAHQAHASSETTLVLRRLQQLYKAEEELRESRAGPELRAKVRGAQSAPLIEELRRALCEWKQSRRFLPQSLMGKAIRYALEQWNWLLAFLSNGELEIDNNLVENAIRPTAIGKKNWLFIGEANAGHRGAIIYTIIESCRRHDIDPYEHLRDVFSRLPSTTNRHVKDLTPAAWAAARRVAVDLQCAA